MQRQPDKTTLDDFVTDGTTIERETFSGCKGNSEVIVYTVGEGGHTWPGGVRYLPAMVIGKTTKNMDASEALWEFFTHHSK